MRLGGFLLASLGLLPGIFLEVYVGYAGRHVAPMAGRPTGLIVAHDVAVVGGLAACVAAMAIVSRLARRTIAEAAGSAGRGGPTGSA